MSEKGVEIGKVATVKGQVHAESAGVVRQLQPGSPIYSNEKIVTGKQGNAELQFKDDTVLSQGPNSSITLNKYVYDENNAKGSDLAFKMAKGTFRVVTGKIAKEAPEKFKLESPLTSIGIRGTTTLHDIQGKSEKHGCEDITQGKTLVVQDQFGEIRNITSPLQMVDATPGKPLSQIRPVSTQEMQHFKAMTPITVKLPDAPPPPTDSGRGDKPPVEGQKGGEGNKEGEDKGEPKGEGKEEGKKEGDKEKKGKGEDKEKKGKAGEEKEGEGKDTKDVKKGDKAGAEEKGSGPKAGEKTGEQKPGEKPGGDSGQGGDSKPSGAQEGQKSALGQDASKSQGNPEAQQVKASLTAQVQTPPALAPNNLQSNPAANPFQPGNNPLQPLANPLQPTGAFQNLAAAAQIAGNPGAAGALGDAVKSVVQGDAPSGKIGFGPTGLQGLGDLGMGGSAFAGGLQVSPANVQTVQLPDSSLLSSVITQENIKIVALQQEQVPPPVLTPPTEPVTPVTPPTPPVEPVIPPTPPVDPVNPPTPPVDPVIPPFIPTDPVVPYYPPDSGGGDSGSTSGTDTTHTSTPGVNTVTGTESADTLIGTTGNDHFDARGSADTIMAYQGGNDTVNAGTGSDNIYMGGKLDSLDVINGGDGTDILTYTDDGNSSSELNGVTSIEAVNFGNDSVDVVLPDSLVGAGSTITMNAAGVDSVYSVYINALAETDGRVNFWSGLGNNTFIGSAGDDTFNMGTTLDTLDTLNGAMGNDYLYFTDNGSGVTDLNCVTGMEYIYLGDSPASTVITLPDTLVASGMHLWLYGTSVTSNPTIINAQAETDGIIYFTGGSQADTFYGGSGEFTFVGNIGNDYFFAGDGTNSFNGSTGTDTFDYINCSTAVTVGAGSTVVHGALTDSYSNVEIFRGSAFADTISQASFKNYYGAGGNDQFSGGSSNATYFNGEDGNDTFANNGGGADLFIDTYIGGNGVDVVDLTATTVSNHYLTVDVSAAGDGSVTDVNQIVSYSGVEVISNSTGSSNVLFEGSSGADTFTGGISNDILYGGAGSDMLNGGDGADKLVGGADADNMTGGIGDDRFVYTSASEFGDTITDFGTGADKLHFNSSAFGNLTTLAVSDFYTLSAYESYSGGSTNPSFIWDSASGNLYYDSSGPATNTDKVFVATLTGFAALDESYFVFYYSSHPGATAGVETLYGGLGDDYVDAGDGADEIHGDEGNDSLYGGLGDDTVYGENGDDTLFYSDGNDCFDGGGDYDILDFNSTGTPIVYNSGGSGSITHGVSTITLTDIERINGSGGGDTFYDTVGNDTFFGFDGNDLFAHDTAGGNDLYAGGAGTDTLDYSSRSAALNIDLTQGLASGGAAVNDKLFGIEYIIAGTGNDTIYTGLSNETFDGRLGDDTFYSGNETSSDTFDGAGGSDTLTYQNYTFGNVSVNMPSGNVTKSGGGVDTVSNVETIMGTASADVFQDNGNNLTFYGMDGNDSFIGSLGSDYYNGGNGSNDILDYSAISASMTMGSVGVMDKGGGVIDIFVNIEVLKGGSINDSFTIDTPIIVYGGTGDDTINAYSSTTDGFYTLYGEAGADTLWSSNYTDSVYGGDGDDVMKEKGGSDYYDGGAGIDMVQYSTGTEAVTYNADGYKYITHGAYLDYLYNVEIIKGSSLADTFHESNGNDTLDGYSGDDTFYLGGMGTDSIEGGLGTDLADYSSVNEGIQINLAAGTASGTGVSDVLSGIEKAYGPLYYGSTFTGSASADAFFGGLGSDTFYPGDGNDYVDGNSGALDTVSYSNVGSAISVEFDSATGGSGTDTLLNMDKYVGTPYDDTFKPSDFSGYKYFDAGSGTGDKLDCSLFVSSPGILLSYSGETGTLYRSGLTLSISGFERIEGTSFQDDISSKASGLTIWGKAGADILHGNTGIDYFHYETPSEGGDLFSDAGDFTPGTDKISYNNANFGSITTLTAANFKTVSGFDGSNGGITAGTPGFVFDGSSHELYYDSNGDTAGGHTLLATFDATTSLTATDLHPL